MDSFYDVPRRLPIPAPLEKLPQAPVVPEISVLCSSKPPTNQYTPYSAWKLHDKRQTVVNKENISHLANAQNNTSYLKKQVRFESPVLRQRPPLASEKDSFGNVPKAMPMDVRTFEQIYLANIPNRHLDLSLIEPSRIPKPPEKVEECPKKVEKPKTYKEFRNLQKDDAVVDIFNYKKESNSPKSDTSFPVNSHRERGSFQRDSTKNDKVFNVFKRPESPVFFEQNSKERNNIIGASFIPQNVAKEPQKNVNYNVENTLPFYLDSQRNITGNLIQKRDNSTQTDPVPVEENPRNDATIKDLLKIISQQNEQLLLLQKQVSALLNDKQNTRAALEMPSQDKYVTSTQHEQETPRKRLQKFSIDMMTSFEVSFRRQPQKNKDFISHEPKIQEITETESCDNKINDIEPSLCLQEPIKVREACPSPEPSIKIDMNDYESSGSDEDAPSEVGTTFYNNLMGQVDEILRKANIQSRGKFENCQPKSEETREKTMNKVKAATLKHLRSIGVNLPDVEGSSLDSDDSEISFAVKQLLMKYLPDEHLAKVIEKKDGEKKPGIIQNRPEFSFATVQYMKKYNLITSGCGNNPTDFKKLPTKKEVPKILDISKLKQQPKLM